MAGTEEADRSLHTTEDSWNFVQKSSSPPGDSSGRSNSLLKGELEFLDDAQLTDMDDEQLDSILDSLLIRIVETLVEMSASDTELREELNAPDKSGFTLLHYASLYNL